jgi:hypothetical protein
MAGSTECTFYANEVSSSANPQESDVLSIKNINPGKKIPTRKK